MSSQQIRPKISRCWQSVKLARNLLCGHPIVLTMSCALGDYLQMTAMHSLVLCTAVHASPPSENLQVWADLKHVSADATF